MKYKWFWTLTLREDLPRYGNPPRQGDFVKWYNMCVDRKFIGDTIDEDIIMKHLKRFNETDKGKYLHGIYINDEPGNFSMEYEYQEKLFYDTD